MSSAVQIGTSDGGFEETAIENQETEAINRRNAHKPLFEQLRSNQEEDQEKKDESERQIMRSTCALDDEDVAHLDSLERQRSDREEKIQERTQNELENFRAAKALRQQAALAGDHKDDDDDSGNNKNLSVATMIGNGKVTPVHTTGLPVIKVKKRKRRMNPIETVSKFESAEKRTNSKEMINSQLELKDENQSYSVLNETRTTTSIKEKEPLSVVVKKNDGGGGLGSLLSGYGSSSDEE